MSNEPPSPLNSALAWLRPPAGRARRWLAARGTVARVVLLLLLLSALGGGGYLASLEDPNDLVWEPVYEGRKLSTDATCRVVDALAASGIPHATDPAGQVRVKPSRKLEALAALAKAKAVPPSLGDLSRDADPGNLFEGPEERERRENRRDEQILEAEIEGLNTAIASAHVRIYRAKKRGSYAAPAEPSSYVYLNLKGSRTLGPRAVKGVVTFLRGAVPGLKPEAITVVDQNGYEYLAANNPALKEQMQAHVREETWRDEIAEELSHIPGVNVSVQLETAPVPPPPEVSPPAAVEVALPNGKVGIEPGPPRVAPAPPIAATRTRANVWVKIPRSYYLLAFRAQSPGRQPGQEDLERLRLTTERLACDAVAMHIPREELGAVKIGVIQDDLVSDQQLMRPSAAEAYRPWVLPVLASAATLTVAGLIAGSIRLATRRPSARPSRSAWKPGFVVDGPSGPVPGPSERVRELIRLNPEAAAGVLQRWIGQGGALE